MFFHLLHFPFSSCLFSLLYSPLYPFLTCHSIFLSVPLFSLLSFGRHLFFCPAFSLSALFSTFLYLSSFVCHQKKAIRKNTLLFLTYFIWNCSNPLSQWTGKLEKFSLSQSIWSHFASTLSFHRIRWSAPDNTDLFYCTSVCSSVSCHTKKKPNVSILCAWQINSDPPLALLSFKEANELMETPLHIVVYFTSGLMQMEGAAMARNARKHCFSAAGLY